MRRSADMQITVTRYTVKLTPLVAFVCADCTAEEESDKGDKLQALTGVFDSVLQLPIQVHRCVKSSDKHCNFFVGMHSAHTHAQFQAV